MTKSGNHGKQGQPNTKMSMRVGPVGMGVSQMGLKALQQQLVLGLRGLPPWRCNKLSKPQTSKSKAARGVKRKHWDWDLDSDGNTEPDSESEVESECCVVSSELESFMCTDLPHRADFTYQVDVSSKAKDIHKVITQSSTTKWPDFEESIAKILNIFTPNLRAQYVLSTEPTNTILIALTSENDLAELHTRLAPLLVPPRNANSSKSKRKMKEVTVKVTDKSNDITSKTSSVGNGKVCNRHIFVLENQESRNCFTEEK